MQQQIGDAMAGDEPRVQSEARLAELLAARICHDLVSPVGAVGNGVDLMREIGGAEAEDLALVAESAARAAAMLKLHRLAFGPQPAEGELHGRRALADRLEPAIATPRVPLDITGTDGPDLAPGTARLAALMALAGRTLAGKQARISLTLARGGDLPLSLSVRGERACWPPEPQDLLRGRTAAATPRHVEFALLPLAAHAAGARLETVEDPGHAGLEALAR